MLIYPSMQPMEGPRAFRLRTLEANLMPGSMVDLLDSDPVFKDVVVDRTSPEDWISRLCRWCPSCLRSGRIAHGRIGWEIRFADACTACGCWLVDRCSGCSMPVRWSRDSYAYCRCGTALRSGTAPEAPAALLVMSQSLERRAQDMPTGQLPILDGLSLHQCLQLVRWLGSYGARMPQRARQKLLESDSLDTSWPVTTLAAEVLAGWPASFMRLLDSLRSAADPRDGGSLSRTFGGFYRALYAAFGTPEYAWVREVFEDYVAEHWSGSMGRRNRRVYERTAEKMEWIPASEAARQAGMSAAALHRMAEQGALKMRSYETDKGRRFSKVNRASLALLLAGSPTQTFPLSEAATALGLTKARLQSLLPEICPEAIKAVPTNIWRIPVTWVDALRDQVSRLPSVAQPVDDGWVSLDWLLRYEAPSSRAMGALINAIVTCSVQAARLGQTDRLSQVLCVRREVRTLWQQDEPTSAVYVSVVEAAHRMQVKQEVAYALVRSGLLAATSRQAGRRASLWVPVAAIAQFEQRYVCGRDLATGLRSSPRAITVKLAELGVQPVAGPGVDGCRQLFFRRADIEHHGISCGVNLATS